jgi:adenylate cyclase class IV
MSSSSTQQQFEIEIKSLLGTADKAMALKEKLFSLQPKPELVEQSKQLNHYFTGGDIQQLTTSLFPHLTADDQARLKNIIEKGKNFSVRTRQQNEKVLMVVKASIDDTTSSNGISRMEFEAPAVDLDLKQLDQLLLNAGMQYQAKWSRERESYRTPDAIVCIDKNAGYGYLAEFEAVVTDATQVEEIKRKLRQTMADLGAEELDQERLARMFAFYNAHWPEYYGTDKVFTVE